MDMLLQPSALLPRLLQVEPLDWGAWGRDALSSFFPWPLIALLALLYLLLWKGAPQRVSALFKPFRSVKLFGAEFILSEEGAREVARNAAESFASYRQQVKGEYDRWAETYDVRQKLEGVLSSDAVTDVLGRIQDIRDFRCTVHVPDVLFAETMYQLLDYYPTGGGAGRTWSARLGMIGRAWRQGESETVGDVPTDPRALVLQWGMTREEAAAAGRGRKSFACIVLRDEEKTAVGIFYMDSKDKDAFGADHEARQRLHDAIIHGCKEQGLTNALARLNQHLRSRGPMIRIYD